MDGEERRAWADAVLVGECAEGDEVIVNVEALDLGLGSGGFDVVHVNLTRGLEDAGRPDLNVLKLNYSSLQHPVEPVEPRGAGDRIAVRDAGARVSSCTASSLRRRGPRRRRPRGSASATSRRRAARSPGRSRATSPSFASAGCSPAT